MPEIGFSRWAFGYTGGATGQATGSDYLIKFQSLGIRLYWWRPWPGALGGACSYVSVAGHSVILVARFSRGLVGNRTRVSVAGHSVILVAQINAGETNISIAGFSRWAFGYTGGAARLDPSMLASLFQSLGIRLYWWRPFFGPYGTIVWWGLRRLDFSKMVSLLDSRGCLRNWVLVLNS